MWNVLANFIIHCSVVAANPIKGNEEGEKEQSSYSSSGDSSLNEGQATCIDSGAEDGKVVEKRKKHIPDNHDEISMNFIPLTSSEHSRSSGTAHTHTFGTSGPPGWDITEALDELTLENEEKDPKTSDTAKGYISLPPSQPISSERHLHTSSNFSTLSQDDITLDAVMGRPPRLPNAEVARRLQQEEERQLREKTEIKDMERMRERESLPKSPAFDSQSSDKLEPPKTESVTSDRGKSEDSEIMAFIKDLAKSFNQPAPTVKLFDAAVVYDKADYESVRNFVEELRTVAFKDFSENLRIELFDSEEFVQSKVLVVADVVDRCSVVFVYLTENSNTEFFRLFCDEAVGLSRLGLNNPGVTSGMAFNDRKWILKPVHTQALKKRTYNTPVGLLTLNGIDWYDWPSDFVRDKVHAVLKSAITQRKSRETERNISMGYKHAFREGTAVYKSSNPIHVPGAAPNRGQKHSFESVDAISFPSAQSTRPMSSVHPQARGQEQNSHLWSPYNQHHQQRYPIDVTPQQIPPQQNFPIYPDRNAFPALIPQWQQPNTGYNIHMPRQNINPYYPNCHSQNIQTPLPPQNVGFTAPAYQPTGPTQQRQVPPSYMSYPMQDNMSHPYIYNSQGPQYNQGASYYGHAVSDPRMHAPHGYVSNSNNIYRSQGNYQGATSQYQTRNLVGQEPLGAAYGSLMIDQRHDTPSSEELKVVSRVTGKLITNPDLSNTDLEIDTNEHSEVKPKDDQTTVKFGTGYNEESSDDSDTDSDDTEAAFKRMFPKDGNVINIFGSSVVQLGKNNRSIGKHKHVYKEKKKEEHFPDEDTSEVKKNIKHHTRASTSDKGTAELLELARPNSSQPTRYANNIDMRRSQIDERPLTKQSTKQCVLSYGIPEPEVLQKNATKSNRIENVISERTGIKETADYLKRCRSIEDNAVHIVTENMLPLASVSDKLYKESKFRTGDNQSTQAKTGENQSPQAQFSFSSFRASPFSVQSVIRFQDPKPNPGKLVSQYVDSDLNDDCDID